MQLASQSHLVPTHETVRVDLCVVDFDGAMVDFQWKPSAETTTTFNTCDRHYLL